MQEFLTTWWRVLPIAVLLVTPWSCYSSWQGNITATTTAIYLQPFLSWNPEVAAKRTLSRCLTELMERGLIVKTREGWFSNPGGRCALYALTWQRIEECEGKDLELGPSRGPYRSFGVESFEKPSTEIGTSPTSNVYRIRPRNKIGQYCSS